MRGSVHRLTIAAALVSLAFLANNAHADPVYEWEYSINSGAYTQGAALTDPSGVASASLMSGKITIVLNYSSNNPGGSTLAELSSQISVRDNSTTTGYTISLQLTETDYSAPSAQKGNFTSSIGSVSVQRASSNSYAANATVGATAYLDDTDTAYGTTYATNSYSQTASSVTSPASLSPQTLAYASNAFTPGSPFSLTVTGTFVLGKNTIASMINDATFVPSIPEPSSMSIAALGAIGMIGYGWRRRKAR